MLWPAPAKLNLFLRIVGVRADGYHLLQTVFQLLDWGDAVRLRPRTDGVVTCAGLPEVPQDRNLCLLAAHALIERCGPLPGVDIDVAKRIPAGGGLGGGSSDAATVLVALNEIWATGLDVDMLASIGLHLGADVPVFVRGETAWAEGIGEQLTPIESPDAVYVIVDPRVAVSTGALFQAPELTRNSPPTTISGYLNGVGVGTENVFEPVARARYPQVAAALDWLGQFGAARLSGSGGCVFAAVDSERAAAEIVGNCPPQFVAHVARGVGKSPLLEAVQRWRRRQPGPR